MAEYDMYCFIYNLCLLARGENLLEPRPSNAIQLRCFFFLISDDHTRNFLLESPGSFLRLLSVFSCV